MELVLGAGLVLAAAVGPLDIPREDAVRAATYNPARQLGCLDEVGSIRDGKQADFVICDAELNRREVWLAGEKLA